MTEMLSGGDMLIRSLQDEGVEYIFGYPGGSALHIYDAIFRQQKIEHILVRHEQAATHMADGYARSTRTAWRGFGDIGSLARQTQSRASLQLIWTAFRWLSSRVRCPET